MAHSVAGSASNVSNGIEMVARIGFAAKAAVYMIMGSIAIEVAVEGASGSMGSKGAIQAIGQQPFGQVLLWATALGMFCYSAWRWTQVFVDPENEGDDAEGLVKRIAYASSGVVHVALGIAAIRLALGSGGGGGGDAKTLTAKVMSHPLGEWAIYAVAAGLAVGALQQAHKAYTAKFMKKMQTGSMSLTEVTWTERAGRAGHAARAVVFGIMAYFLANAAMNHDPSQAVGLDGALSKLAQQSHGTILLSLAAIGLFLYGIYMAMLSRYRAIPYQ